MIIIDGSLHIDDGKLKALDRDGRTITVACELIFPENYNPNKDRELLWVYDIQTIKAASIDKSLVTHMGGGRIVAVELAPLRLLPFAPKPSMKLVKRKDDNGKAH